ncbi:P-loop containing nucleoside triphosphate hydrolase protein [Mycena crocata]|nr:P-loop containing nucleoside triphosphate hydrolase protein [Mycena crocata]
MSPQSEVVERTVPMKVLALGFPRTGTSSLKVALETLGYVKTNHGYRVFWESNPEVMPMWIAAIKAKFHGEGKLYGKPEWDRLLGDCQAVADIPHILFAEELIAAYPDAKVVLTNRSPDSWWNSYKDTVVKILSPTLQLRIICLLDPQFSGTRERLSRLGRAALFKTDHLTEEVAKTRFVEHYEEIRRLVPEQRLLEFDVKDGWAPLCEFLGNEVPVTPFPRVNDKEQFNKRLAVRRATLSWRLAVQFAGPLLVVIFASALIYRA